jgi:hypothetical protein
MDAQLFSQSVRSLATADDKKESGLIGPQVSELAHAKNAAILESTINANLTSGNDPQSLVLKTALEGINEALRETFGDDSIQAAYEESIMVADKYPLITM